MNDLLARLPDWPSVFAVAVCSLVVYASAQEDLGFPLPSWLHTNPETPVPDARAPRNDASLPPYAPAPGRDDRTPVEYVSQVFGLGDAALPEKLSGVGPVFWKSGRGTGALIGRDLVLTTAHVFVRDGKWIGADTAVPFPPDPVNGSIFLAACGRSYAFRRIEVGSEAPRSRLGLDYAIAWLAEPACEDAATLPVLETPSDIDLLGAKDTTILNIGAYVVTDLPRYAKHPFFAGRMSDPDGPDGLHVFGVRCRIIGFEDTGDVGGMPTGVIVTEGCDGVPGGSGGPLIAAFGGAADYSIIGVANSYRPKSEYNNYTRIEGVFAEHLTRHAVPGASAPALARPAARPGSTVRLGEGRWRPTGKVDHSPRRAP